MWQHAAPVSPRDDAPLPIRPAGLADLAALSLVGQATFLESYAGVLDSTDILAHCAHEHSPDLYRSTLRQPRARAWLAEAPVGRAAVGYILLGENTLLVPDRRPDDLEIKRIYLLHRFHGTGTGRALMDTALAAAREMGACRVLLGVYSRNTRALAFYDRAGFHHAGERRFLVGATLHDDFILARDL
jgi:ribosomal protein S18 acetylase RimI-like enzyme